MIKLAAKLGLCQHVLPGSDSNDGLAHLTFISGKFSLHPVYYELAGICLIVFASTTLLDWQRLRPCSSSKPSTAVHCKAAGHCFPQAAQGGDQGWHSVTQSNSSQPPSPPETQSPKTASLHSKKSLFLQGSLSSSLHETGPPL